LRGIAFLTLRIHPLIRADYNEPSLTIDQKAHMTHLTVQGTTAEGFESIRQLFEQNMRRYLEDKAQLCIYVDDHCVVDLWASPAADTTFDGDALINIFSSGKSLESIAMAWLVSENRLQLSDQVTDYWPEYGAAGKAQQTIADVMRHEAGLAALNQPLDPKDLHREQLKQNKIGAIIAAHPTQYRSGGIAESRDYHALSRGWIANEIFRRADAQGRTIGEFFETEIRGPFNVNLHIGVADVDMPRIAKLRPVSIGNHLLQSAWPFAKSRKTHNHLLQLLARIGRIVFRALTSPGIRPKTAFKDMPIIDAFNHPLIIQGETPSANAHCSARGLARIGSALAMGGASQGTTLINPEAWQALHAEPITRDMSIQTSFTQGGVAYFSEDNAGSGGVNQALNRGREGFYGWMGLGGSIFQWHPEKKISIAFVPTSLHMLDLVNERGKTYQAELLRCVG
jgi:CubicO group peptidase (beta-lactamase class C family)